MKPRRPDPRIPIQDALATPEGKRRYVGHLFSAIADRYDCLNVVLSFGRDRAWKRRLVRLADVQPGEHCLDLACGTGDIAFLLERQGATVTALDIAPRMIELARAKEPGSGVEFVLGDMTALPFGAESFDLVTTGYGLRNAPVLDSALAEILRVLKPGGRFLSLDFNRPDRAWVRAPYLAYLAVVGRSIGLAFHRRAETYGYIFESVRRYPGAGGVARRMRDLGFLDVQWQPILGGFMAIHLGRRPSAGA